MPHVPEAEHGLAVLVGDAPDFWVKLAREDVLVAARAEDLVGAELVCGEARTHLSCPEFGFRLRVRLRFVLFRVGCVCVVCELLTAF